ncbi:MAG: cytochrome b/b6 domain-containing protein [bacterium]|nr:cytochrome b/b6 domain-containing protein [bacterium]MDT8395314.1 cytochrome b/b6 domain-containing protein [bacterium]
MKRDIHETDMIHQAEGYVVRHSFLVMMQHWLVALSGLVLLFSGFGQMPLYKRYMLNEVPGLGWVSDFILQFEIHMVAAAVFTFAGIFHLVYHYIEGGRSILPMKGDVRESIHIIKAILKGEKEPPHGKFLAEQRLAYALIGFSIILLIVTGFVKFADNLPAVDMPWWATFWNTMLHNVGTVLFFLAFIAHIGAFVLKANWPLFSSMFSGKVKLDYAEERHPLWMDEIRRGEATKNKMMAECVVRIFAGTMVGTGVLLGAILDPLWYLLPAFVAVNLIQSAFTRWCPLENMLVKLGYPRGKDFIWK